MRKSSFAGETAERENSMKEEKRGMRKYMKVKTHIVENAEGAVEGEREKERETRKTQVQ